MERVRSSDASAKVDRLNARKSRKEAQEAEKSNLAMWTANFALMKKQREINVANRPLLVEQQSAETLSLIQQQQEVD